MAGFCGAQPQSAAKTESDRMQTHRKSASQKPQAYDLLPPEPSQIRRPRANVVHPTEVEDAVFEVLAVSPHPYRRVNDNPPRAKAVENPELLPFLAKFAGRLAAVSERQLSRLSPQAFVTLLSSLVLCVFWACGGFSAFTQSSAQPLAFHDFALVDTFTGTEDANGMKVAVVGGAVRNTSGRIIDAPRLSVVDGSRRDIVGTVVLSVDRIGPGVTIPFSARFKLAGGKASDIAIIPERR
jgi:hypothetical protein